MKKFSFSLACILMVGVALNAQHENVMITSSNSPEEPAIYVNPYDTDKLIAGSNINNLFYSDDGGYTWTVTTLYSASYGVWGDPVTIVDTAGNYYFFHLSNPPAGSWIDRIVCQKSTDEGLTWNEGSYMGLNGTKAQDKQWAVVDRTNNTIYVTWTEFDDYGSSNPNDYSRIMFSKSTDEGESWSPALNINEVDGNCIDSDETTEGAVPAVGPNGEVYVAWAGPEGLVFDRSLDGGETWLDEDIFIDEFPGGWDYNIPGISRCNGLPITVCDLSGGPYHGNIYVNWTDQRNGTDDTDVWVVRSEDGGDSWTEPIRVNDDGPGKQQFFTWMAVDQVTGYLWFVWYDRRDYDDTNTDVYMAVSMDGGETYVNYKVSEDPFVPSSNVFFGDYNCVSVHDNDVRPIWTRLHNGQLSVWTAIVDVDAIISVDVAEKEIFPYAEMGPNYPNPFNESTIISFRLKTDTEVSLEVYDMVGNRVAVLFENEYRPFGKYTEYFDASRYNLSPGMYYFSLSGEGLNLKRKMMLLR